MAESEAVDPQAEVERQVRGKPMVAMLLAWLVPGAGHLYLGRLSRGVIFFALVMISLTVGCNLDGKLYEWGVPGMGILQYAATFASYGMGLVYWILDLGLGYQGQPAAAGYEYGTTFVLTSGLMNLLLILDAGDIARGHKE